MPTNQKKYSDKIKPQNVHVNKFLNRNENPQKKQNRQMAT